MNKVKTVLETLLLGLLIAGCGYAQRVSYSGSMQYAAGSYFFGETTRSFYLTNGFTVGGDRGSLTFNLPFIIQNTPWVSYSAGGYLPTGGTQHGTVGRRSGGMSRMEGRITLSDTSSYTKANFSDPTFNLGVKLLSGATTTLFLNSGLKIPLADPTNGFGTGAWDFGAGLSVSQRLSSFFFDSGRHVLVAWRYGGIEIEGFFFIQRRNRQGFFGRKMAAVGHRQRQLRNYRGCPTAVKPESGCRLFFI